MSIFIDSANSENVQKAYALGWVQGITTNPKLLAESDLIKRDRGRVEELLTTLRNLGTGPLFYQLISTESDELLREAQWAARIVGEDLVFKVPPTELGFWFVSQYRTQFNCCVTAIYSSAQAMVACQAGAQYVAVYFNRAEQLNGSGVQLVHEVDEMLSASANRDCQCEIIAASLKNPAQACAAIIAGAHHITAAYSVLLELIAHPYSAATVKEFQNSGVGLLESLRHTI